MQASQSSCYRARYLLEDVYPYSQKTRKTTFFLQETEWANDEVVQMQKSILSLVEVPVNGPNARSAYSSLLLTQRRDRHTLQTALSILFMNAKPLGLDLIPLSVPENKVCPVIKEHKANTRTTLCKRRCFQLR